MRVCAGEYTDSSYLIDTFFVVVPFWVHMKTLKKEGKENNNSQCVWIFAKEFKLNISLVKNQ